MGCVCECGDGCGLHEHLLSRRECEEGLKEHGKKPNGCNNKIKSCRLFCSHSRAVTRYNVMVALSEGSV